MIFRIFNQYVPVRRLLLFGVESSFILLIVAACPVLLQGTLRRDGGGAHLLLEAVLIAAVVQMCLYYCELYDFKIFRSNLELMIRLLQSLGFALIVLAAIYFLFPSIRIGRGVLLFSLIFISLGVICWRFLYNGFLKMKYLDQKILILGEGPLATGIAREVLDRRDCGFKVIGFTTHDSNRVGERLVNPSIIGTHGSVAAIAEAQKLQRIIVAHDDRRGRVPLDQLLKCKTGGIMIEEGSEFYEHLTGKIDIDHLHPSTMIFSDGFRKTRMIKLIKRAMDCSLAFAGLVILSPVMAAAALLIKLDTPGPVFYQQERVGENGRVFKLLKFRSMRDDAEKNGPVWASVEDDRVTRIGKWLRKGRLDEIPQMINVLTGSMSFVGPRPERPHFVRTLRTAIPYYDQRSCVPPGITGWAQIRYPYGASLEDAAQKLRYDLYYIKNMSLTFDLFIIFDTIKIVLFGKGAR